MYRMRNTNNIKQELQISNSSSKGENLIHIILLELNYHALKECTVSINKTLYAFDFSIWDMGQLLGFIEYDGEQHYYPIEHFGGDEGFRKNQKNDALKNNFCVENNLTLLRIPYFSPKTKAAYKEMIIEAFPTSKKTSQLNIPNFIGANSGLKKNVNRNSKSKKKKKKNKENRQTPQVSLTFPEFKERYGLNLSIEEFEQIIATKIVKLTQLPNTPFIKVLLMKKSKKSNVLGVRLYTEKDRFIFINHTISNNKLKLLRTTFHKERELDNLKNRTSTPSTTVSKKKSYSIQTQTIETESFTDIIEDHPADIHIICRSVINKETSYFQGKIVDSSLKILDDIYFEYNFRGIYKAAIYGVHDYIDKMTLKNKKITLISSGLLGMKAIIPKKDPHKLKILAEIVDKNGIEINHIVSPILQKDIKAIFRQKNVSVQKTTTLEKKNLPFKIVEIEHSDKKLSTFLEDKKNEAVVLIKAGYNPDLRTGYYKALLRFGKDEYYHEITDKVGMTTNLGILYGTKYLLQNNSLSKISINLVHITDLGFNSWTKSTGTNLIAVDELVTYIKENELNFQAIRYKGPGAKIEIDQLFDNQ